MEPTSIPTPARRRQRNSFFTFKKFHIEQKDCAMKVSSDGCLFGAVIDVESAVRVLDIGTGSGLLALMVAQRAASFCQIDAVEICSRAAYTAQQNVAGSPFASMIRIFSSPIQEFQPDHGEKYDVIIANPPFFQNALLGKDAARNIARHSQGDALDFAGLLQAADRLLHDRGKLWVLLPPGEMQQFAQLALGFGLEESSRIAVSHKPGDPEIRRIAVYSRAPGALQVTSLVRCCDDGTTPSPAAHALLKDYMLYY